MGDVSPPFNLVYMSGLAGAIGGIISSGINYVSNRETNKANQHLAELANQWSLDQWNRENAYNNPVAQVERLKAAGLNPAMMYGQGGIQNLAADSPAVTSAAGTQRAFQIDPLTAAQIANINADTNQKKVQSGLFEAETDLTRNQVKVGDSVILHNTALAKMTDSQRLNIEQQTKNLAKEIDVMQSEIDKNFASVEQYRAEVARMDVQNRNETIQVMADQIYKNAQVKAMFEELEIKHQEANAYCRLVAAQCSLANAEEVAAYARALESTEHGEYLKKQAALAGQAFDHNEVMFDIDEKYYGTEKTLGIITSTIAGIADGLSGVSGIMRGLGSLKSGAAAATRAAARPSRSRKR